MRLRTKTALIAVSLTVTGLAVGFLITYWFLLGLRLADLDEANSLVARVILDAFQEARSVGLSETMDDYLVRESGVSAAQVFRSGLLEWQGGPYEVPVPLDPAGVATGRGERTVGAWRVFTLRSENLVVQVARPVASLQAILQHYLTVTSLVTVVIGMLALFLAWLSARLAARPIEQLSRAVEDFDESGYVPEPTGNDEAATLARGFARLLGRLRAQRRRELQFLAYATHELRTPVAALRASLEVVRLRDGRIETDALARLRREASRLEEFTQNLLALSRAEARDLRFEPVDLGEIVGAAYDRLQPLALERGKELQLKPVEAQVRADPRLLDQALNNLVFNSIRYSSGRQITVGNGRESDRPYIEVIDEGPGLASQSSEGLGLRVVRAVARVHEGELEFMSGQSFQVRLWLSPHLDTAPKRSLSIDELPGP